MTEEVHLPSQDDALRSVGQGIQAFSHVEFALAMLYATLMEPADHSDSVITIDAARHIETKLRIIKAVGKRQLSGTRYDTFTNLMNRAAKRADFRHKLAHWVVGFWPGASSAEEIKAFKVAVVPPVSSAARGPVIWGGEQPIHIEQIDQFRDQCTELVREILAFSDQIGAAKRDH